MLTTMTEGLDDRFGGICGFAVTHGDKGRDDRKFLEALHYFVVQISLGGRSPEFGQWNSVWKRFWRLSRSALSKPFSMHWQR